jgi:hypothetical protein
MLCPQILLPQVSARLIKKDYEQAFKEIQSLAGVLTNKEQNMLSQANDPYIAYNFKRH